jgi:hypothetical protein
MEEEEKKKEGKYIYPLDEISAIFGRKPQPMRDDPRSLAIPCFIGEVNIEAALCDFDSNINLMTLSLVDKLMTDPWELEPIDMARIKMTNS